MPDLFRDARQQRFAAFIVMALLFLAAVRLGLLVPIFTGLLVYVLVMRFSWWLVRHGNLRGHAIWIAILLVTVVVVLMLVALGFGAHLALIKGRDIHLLLLGMSDILDSARNWLPETLRTSVPEGTELMVAAGQWLRTHAGQIGSLGLNAITGIGLALIGILLGAMFSVSHASQARRRQLGPVSQRLLAQVIALRESFWRVASAQVKISSINTVLTGLYLAVILPLFGVQLPFTKTLIAVTFIAGLLPVLGNLISNTAITIISLSHSLLIAATSLAFLVVIHKLEYFINARIIGVRIDARAVELLLAMVLMERLFGPVGVVAAPVFYAWAKAEWLAWDSPVPPAVTGSPTDTRRSEEEVLP